MAELDDTQLGLMDRYWRAANYVSVGQIYLMDNPLLREPLKAGTREAPAARPLGYDARAELHLRASEPGHQGTRTQTSSTSAAPAMAGRQWSPTPISRALTARSIRRSRRMKKDCRSCSGSSRSRAACPATSPQRRPVPSTRAANSATHLSMPSVPLSTIPTSSVACVVGDGEAETGPLAAAWHSNKFLNPQVDGAVLPILHLNGYKIANPTLLARMSDAELARSFQGLRLRAALRRGA